MHHRSITILIAGYSFSFHAISHTVRIQSPITSKWFADNNRINIIFKYIQNSIYSRLSSNAYNKVTTRTQDYSLLYKHIDQPKQTNRQTDRQSRGVNPCVVLWDSPAVFAPPSFSLFANNHPSTPHNHCKPGANDSCTLRSPESTIKEE